MGGTNRQIDQTLLTKLSKYRPKKTTKIPTISRKTRIIISKINVDFIGFHGQTIFHNAEEHISRQLGDGKLLSKLTKKKVIYNFRQNDLKNGGQGAPLTPIFHQLIIKKYKLKLPALILNIGGKRLIFPPILLSITSL